MTNAYQVLQDAEKRALYDRGGEAAIKEGGQGGGNPSDIFDMLFGGGRRGQRERRGKDMIHQLNVCCTHPDPMATDGRPGDAEGPVPRQDVQACRAEERHLRTVPGSRWQGGLCADLQGL